MFSISPWELTVTGLDFGRPRWRKSSGWCRMRRKESGHVAKRMQKGHVTFAQVYECYIDIIYIQLRMISLLLLLTTIMIYDSCVLVIIWSTIYKEHKEAINLRTIGCLWLRYGPWGCGEANELSRCDTYGVAHKSNLPPHQASGDGLDDLSTWAVVNTHG